VLVKGTLYLVVPALQRFEIYYPGNPSLQFSSEERAIIEGQTSCLQSRGYFLKKLSSPLNVHRPALSLEMHQEPLHFCAHQTHAQHRLILQ
jgi:hypothetical protein